MQPMPQTDQPDHKAQQIIREYEDFAYIVSHDLNAPLRHVKEFTRLLIGMRQHNLNEEEKDYVHFLEQSLHKLDDMQRALLTFSRLNTHTGPLRETNFNHAVNAALKDLKNIMDEYDPLFNCADLPALVADPIQIQLLFFHLIENALKFHDSDKKRRISIHATDQGKSWLFEIKDNGIGIPKKDYEEVFRMFKQLEPGKYPGTGAGLTIARKIVQRHGGEIFIESEMDDGTSVFFRLPCQG